MISSEPEEYATSRIPQLSSLLAAASTCLSVLPNALAKPPPKKVLLLGGTVFVGPALIDALLANGHSVTLFNRGVTNADWLWLHACGRCEGSG